MNWYEPDEFIAPSEVEYEPGHAEGVRSFNRDFEEGSAYCICTTDLVTGAKRVLVLFVDTDGGVDSRHSNFLEEENIKYVTADGINKLIRAYREKNEQ